MADKTGNPSSLVRIGSDSGHVIVNKNSQLRRLNYFDGKFLRAPDLILEQQALLNQVRQSNRAGGAGVVHGFDCTLAGGDSLQIGAGFAIDFSGRMLLLNNGIDIGIQELIEKSQSDLAGATSELAQAAATQFASSVTSGDSMGGFDNCVIHAGSAVLEGVEDNDLYLITISHAEAYCGQEDVYGKLCSEACSTSKSHSYIIEGIELRAVPLDLSVLLKQSAAVPLSQVHLRSRVASAFFAEERERIASHISAGGLNSMIWCLGAEAAAGNGIPIAVLGYNGTTTLFLDAWSARRERMESPPRHYWAGRMAMRPWNVFLAQVLQFQCQLRGCLTSSDPDAPCKPLKEFDPCADSRAAAREAATGMRHLIDSFGEVSIRLAEFDIEDSFKRKLDDFDGGLTRLEHQYQLLIDSGRVQVPNRLLINCGIVEVPSAGYLPVNASSTVSVNQQVQRLLGEGVDLRFCVVRPDFVPHALEEAQHMDRICLLSGIDDPSRKPRVDVLVPNGKIQQLETQDSSSGYQAGVAIHSEAFEIGWPRKFITDSVDRLDENVGLAINTSLAGIRMLSTAASDLPTLTGAARGETLESTGYGFYLAARSSAIVKLGTATLARAHAASESVLKLLSGQDDGNAAVASAEAGVERLSSGFRFKVNSASAVLEAQSSRLVPSSAMWLDLKCQSDPFNLNVSESTDVRARLSMIVSRNQNNTQSLVIEERNVNGQLQIQKSAAQKTDTRFTARLVANGIWSETRIFGDQSETRSEAIRLDETVIVSRSGLTGLPPTVAIAIVNPSFFGKLDSVQLVFERIWSSPTESRVRSLLRYQGSAWLAGVRELQAVSAMPMNFAATTRAQTGREIVLAEVNLHEDQNVLRPGNAFHSAALGAINTIAKATRDSGFTDQAGRLLFPPPQPVTSELRILAREPWVLFHRRRDKVCAAETAQEVLAKPRRYRVYHVHLDNQIDVGNLEQALQIDASGVIAKFDTKPVTVVDFAPGLVTVTTAHGDVRADWKAKMQIDADVHIGLIASEGDVINDGEVLADNRLQGLTDLLAPVSEIADDLSLLSVNEVPPTLAAGEVDGVIVYFTKAVATICHSVFRVVSNDSDAIIERLQGFLQQSSGESLPSFVQKLGAQMLTVNPRFIGGSDTYFGASEAQQLASVWDLVDDGPVSRAVSIGFDATDESKLVTRQQTSRITKTVGSAMSADNVGYLEGPASIFKPCPRASLLMAETDCNDLYFYTPLVKDPAKLVEQLTAVISASGFPPDALKSGATESRLTATMITHFAPVDFYRDTDRFEASSRQQFLLKWESQLAGNTPAGFNGFYLLISRAGENAEETTANLAEAKAQGEKLQDIMGISSVGVFPVTNAAVAQFPVECKVLTLLVFLREAERIVDIRTHAMMAINTSNSDDGNAGTAMNLELARNVNFDENNEVVRDANFNAALERVIANESKVKLLELVSIDSTTDKAAEARARSLLKLLKEEGVANKNAKLVVRSADPAESAEIFRSGFLLNRGMVLR